MVFAVVVLAIIIICCCYVCQANDDRIKIDVRKYVCTMYIVFLCVPDHNTFSDTSNCELMTKTKQHIYISNEMFAKINWEI